MKTAICLFAPFLMLQGFPANAQVTGVELIKDESRLIYQISHPLHEVEAVSNEVAYRVGIDPVRRVVTDVSARVDVTTFDSGNSNRDSHAMEVIDAISYPEATFSSTMISQNGDSVKVAGKLTFHGITKDIIIPAALHWSPNRLEVHGEFEVSLTAFNVERPSLLMIPVSDRLRFIVVAAYRWD